MTKKQICLRLATATLLGITAAYMVGCSKPVESTITPANTAPIAPVAGTTIGTDIDDAMLTTHVKAALLDNVDVKSFDLKVETRKGEVMLSGFVDNQTQIDNALAIARAVPGVVSVINSVNLKGAPTTLGTKIDDAVITTQVKAALIADDNIKGADISAVTRDGVVQLSGFVNNQGQVDRALEVAHSIEGVSRVSNELSLKK
jgi:hyperosmotically inducible protein